MSPNTSHANKTKVLLSWSGGKDCAWALHLLRKQDDIEIAGIFTIIDAATNRVSMHRFGEELLEAQAAAMGLPLTKLFIPDPCPNDEYEKVMGGFVKRTKAREISAIAFGDLFLEDIRNYREEKLAGTGIEAIFPLWSLDTTQLAREMVDCGLRAYITSVDTKQLDASFVGRIYDPKFLDDLPAGVDPCGEHGEFHSFVYDGPMFVKPVDVRTGEITRNNEFVYADIVKVEDC